MRPHGHARAARLTAFVESALNLAVAAILTLLAAAVLVSAVGDFVRGARDDRIPGAVVELLDKMLLVLKLVEIVHTVGIALTDRGGRPDGPAIIGR